MKWGKSETARPEPHRKLLQALSDPETQSVAEVAVAMGLNSAAALRRALAEEPGALSRLCQIKGLTRRRGPN